MIGADYVGLVSAACFSEFGWKATYIDKNAAGRIERAVGGSLFGDGGGRAWRGLQAGYLRRARVTEPDHHPHA